MISDIIQRRWTYFQLFIAEAERFFWEQPYDLSWGLDISPFFNRTVLSVCRNKQPKYHLRWHIEHFENSPMIYDIILKGWTYFQLFIAEAERFFENSPMISDIIQRRWTYFQLFIAKAERFFWEQPYDFRYYSKKVNIFSIIHCRSRKIFLRTAPWFIMGFRD